MKHSDFQTRLKNIELQKEELSSDIMKEILKLCKLPNMVNFIITKDFTAKRLLNNPTIIEWWSITWKLQVLKRIEKHLDIK